MAQAIKADPFFYYLDKMQEYANTWIDIDDYSAIFEADSPETQEAVDNNKKAKSGIKGAFSKAIEAIKRIISNIKTSISSFFKKLKMDDTERQAYEAYKKAAKSDPALKNTKINVVNYQNAQKEFEQLNKQCDEAIKSVDKGQTEFTQLFDSIKGFTGKLGKGTAGAFTVDAALRIAASDKHKAQVILAGLQHDEILCNELMDAVGEKQFDEFSKNVNLLAQRNSLKANILRRKMNMANAYTNSLTGNIEKAFKDTIGAFGVKGVYDAHNTAKDIKQNANSNIKDAMTRDLHSVQDVKDAVKDVASNTLDKMDANAEVRAKAWNSGRLLKGMSGTREGRAAVELTKGVAKGAAKGAVQGIKANKNAKKAIRRAEREENFINGGKRRRIKKQMEAEAQNNEE